jgi:conjugal transfer pilus assembly protein TraD
VSRPNYEAPWRPNYELIAVAGWASGVLMAFVIMHHVHLPQQPFLVVAAISGLMLIYRLMGASMLARRKRRLYGKPLTFITAKQLKKKIAGCPNARWLGYGFEWDTPHIQKAFEIMKNGTYQIVRHQRTGIGWRFLHGLSDTEEDIVQPLTDAAGHTLLVGTTGSGKTRTLEILIAQSIMRGNAVIIIDPKSDKDLLESTRRACQWAGDESKFMYFHPAFPESSIRIDPLQNYTRPTELASRIATLIPSETGADPFKAFGQMALNNVIQGMIIIGEHPSLRNIRRYLEGGPERLVERAVRAYATKVMPHWEELARPYYDESKSGEARALGMAKFYRDEIQPFHPSSDLEGLLSMYHHDRTHFSKMVASLLPIMSMLTSGEIGRLLSSTNDDIDDPRVITDMASIVRNGRVAYIALDSLSDAMVGSAIGSMLLSDLTAVAGDRYNFGVGDREVDIYVDEAAEVINDQVIQIGNKGRSAKFNLTLAMQTFADVVARTGDEARARQVLGNLNNVIALRVLDQETQKYIAESLPKTRIRYVMTTQGTSTDSSNPVLFSGNVGERLMEEEAELFPPALLGNLPDLEYIAKLSGGRIKKVRIPILKLDETEAA